MLKWIATLAIVMATICRSFDYHMADMIIGGFGTALWAYAAYQMKDKPLFAVNAFCMGVLIYGVLK